MTYIPGNSAGFQVEMANVGIHYYRWRYPEMPDTPPGMARRSSSISTRLGSEGNFDPEIWVMDANGSNVCQLTMNAVSDLWPDWGLVDEAVLSSADPPR